VAHPQHQIPVIGIGEPIWLRFKHPWVSNLRARPKHPKSRLHSAHTVAIKYKLGLPMLAELDHYRLMNLNDCGDKPIHSGAM
jgi:hypothetical protein